MILLKSQPPLLSTVDVCGCNHAEEGIDSDVVDDSTGDDDDEKDAKHKMAFPRTAEQHAAFKRLALELETDAKLVTLAGWRPYTRPRDLRKTFVSSLIQLQ